MTPPTSPDPRGERVAVASDLSRYATAALSVRTRLQLYVISCLRLPLLTRMQHPLHVSMAHDNPDAGALSLAGMRVMTDALFSLAFTAVEKTPETDDSDIFRVIPRGTPTRFAEICRVSAQLVVDIDRDAQSLDPHAAGMPDAVYTLAHAAMTWSLSTREVRAREAVENGATTKQIRAAVTEFTEAWRSDQQAAHEATSQEDHH